MFLIPRHHFPLFDNDRVLVTVLVIIEITAECLGIARALGLHKGRNTLVLSIDFQGCLHFFFIDFGQVLDHGIGLVAQVGLAIIEIEMGKDQIDGEMGHCHQG